MAETPPVDGQQSPKTDAGVPVPDPDNQAGYDEDNEDKSSGTGNPGVDIAQQFLKRAYFTHLHRFGDKPEDHPWRGHLCFTADFVLRLIAAALILGVAFVVAWKSLAPLPWQ